MFGIPKMLLGTTDVSPVVALFPVLWEAERNHVLEVMTEVFKQ